MKLYPSEQILQSLSWTGEWHQNLSEYTATCTKDGPQLVSSETKFLYFYKNSLFYDTTLCLFTPSGTLTSASTHSLYIHDLVKTLCNISNFDFLTEYSHWAYSMRVIPGSPISPVPRNLPTFPCIYSPIRSHIRQGLIKGKRKLFTSDLRECWDVWHEYKFLVCFLIGKIVNMPNAIETSCFVFSVPLGESKPSPPFIVAHWCYVSRKSRFFRPIPPSLLVWNVVFLPVFNLFLF